MSRVFFVDETCEDIEIFVDKNRVKTDDILVFNTANGVKYRLCGSKQNCVFLKIPEHVTERYEDAMLYFSDAIRQLEIEIRFSPHNKAIARRIGFIDDRVTCVIINFSNRYDALFRVKYGDCRMLLIKNNFQKCWDEQNFATFSSAITNAIDSELDSYCYALFITSSTPTVMLDDPESRYAWFGSAQTFPSGTQIVIESKNKTKRFCYAHEVSMHRAKFKWKLRHIAVEKILDNFVNKQKKSVFNYCVGNIDCVYLQTKPGHWDLRGSLHVSSRKVHNYVMELSLVLCKLFEPYISLEIIRWLPTTSYISRHKKIAIIENVMRYVRSRNATKDSISMRTRAKSLKTQ